MEYSALRGGPRRFERDFSGPALLGMTSGSRADLHIPGSYRLWPGFPTCSAVRAIGNSLEGRQPNLDGPTTPCTQRLPA